MANPVHLQILRRSVEAWNQWREQHREIALDLTRADLDGAKLVAGAKLSIELIVRFCRKYAKIKE